MVKFIKGTLIGSALLFSTNVFAGPFILAGTDADDHGSVNGGVNQTGWKFMQRALENLAPNITNGNTNVVNLGSSGGRAQSAATSAFGLSSLVGNGFSFTNIDGVAALTSFFAGTGTVNINNTALIMMDSGGNVSGGSSSNERAVFTTNASIIDTFLGNGGGLFSQSNGYAWVTSLLPSLVIVPGGGSGANLTLAGNSAFPGLTNADLTGGPRHNRFSNTGALPVLAVDNQGVAVIIGASGGSVTNPGSNTVPEPATLALLGLGLAAISFSQKKKTA